MFVLSLSLSRARFAAGAKTWAEPVSSSYGMNHLFRFRRLIYGGALAALSLISDYIFFGYSNFLDFPVIC